MRALASAAFIILLLSACFAANYTAEYTAGNWLKVTRTIQILDNPCFSGAVSNICMNSGAIFPMGSMSGYYTKVSLTVQNTGKVLREGISVGENLAYVPAGVNITFLPAPSSNDGRQVFWGIGGLGAGESKSVAYEFPAAFREGSIDRIPPVSIVSAPVLVWLSVPSSSKVGDSLAITLRTVSGQPVEGVTVYVGYPDGTSQPVLTGKGGVAAFIANRLGYYTYSVDGYQLSAPVSTETRQNEPAVPPVAAAAVGTGLLPSITGIFPVLAAIFAIAVVALMIYNFASRKGEREEAPYVPAQQVYSPSAAAAPAYTQKFTFGREGEQQESKIRETTRGVLESRKRQLQESAQSGQHEEEQGIWKGGETHQEAEDRPAAGRGNWGQEPFETGGQPAQQEEETEKTFSELDAQVAQLEAQARAEGESAREEEDIEKTIAELESIREKLRSRKFTGGPEKEEEAEPKAQAKKPKYPEPEQARPRPKPHKMRYASHGTRRK